MGPVSAPCPGSLFSPRSMSIASSSTLAQVKELFLGLSPRALVYENCLSPEIIHLVASLYTLNLNLSLDISLEILINLNINFSLDFNQHVNVNLNLNPNLTLGLDINSNLKLTVQLNVQHLSHVHILESYLKFLFRSPGVV